MIEQHPLLRADHKLAAVGPNWSIQFIQFYQGGGGNSLRPYSQQRPMRTNLSCCLGFIDNGQHKSTTRLLVLVPHERSHRIMWKISTGGPENEGNQRHNGARRR